MLTLDSVAAAADHLEYIFLQDKISFVNQGPNGGHLGVAHAKRTLSLLSEVK